MWLTERREGSDSDFPLPSATALAGRSFPFLPCDTWVKKIERAGVPSWNWIKGTEKHI